MLLYHIKDYYVTTILFSLLSPIAIAGAAKWFIGQKPGNLGFLGSTQGWEDRIDFTK